MPITMQHMSTSTLVGTALSVALAPRPGAASVQQGAELLKAFPGGEDAFSNWAINADPCGESPSTWQGVGCSGIANANQVYAIQLKTNGTTQPSSIPVVFGELPESVWFLELQGPVFTESATNCAGLGGLTNLLELRLINTTNLSAQCSWNDLPLRWSLGTLALHSPGVQFEPNVPWGSLGDIPNQILNIELVGMGLTGTVDLAPLCNVNRLKVSGNNFTHINWARYCDYDASDCFTSPSPCLYQLDVSQNAIEQAITADELPRHLKTLRLQNNPNAVGALEITSLPKAFRDMDAGNFSSSIGLSNTRLCFTGTAEDFEGPAGARFVPRQCSIDQGRGLLAAFPGAFPGSWIANTDPCGLNPEGPDWKGIGCGGFMDPPEALTQVMSVTVESYGISPPIPVRFDSIPFSTDQLSINGTSFKLADCKGLHSLSKLSLINMATPEAVCDWDDFPADVRWPALSIQGPSVRFSSSVVPWSKFAGLDVLYLSDVGLTGTVDLAPLCRVRSILVPGNNFTRINWAPNCDCNQSAYKCVTTLDVSQNAIDQTMTAGDLPPYIATNGGSLLLNDNPMVQGALNATEMPPGILRVISDANEADYVDFQNTGLCFTGMHSASVATNLTQAQKEWFADRSCPTPTPATTAPPASTHTAAVIAGSVVGSVALLALIGAGFAYGMMRKRAGQRGSVTTEDEESLMAEYEMKESMN